MGVCQVYRSEDKIVKVLARNENPSKLYKDILNYIKGKDTNAMIRSTPYLQIALSEGKILNNSPEEVALGLWSIAYTDDYQAFLNNAQKGGLVFTDDNDEPKFAVFSAGVLGPANSYKSIKKTAFTLNSETTKIVNKAIANGNELQQRIAETLMINPDNPVILEPVSHIYYDTSGNPYTSVTTAIKGKLEDPNDIYGINREYGQAFDKILEGIIIGQSWADIQKIDDLKVLSSEQQKQAFNILQAYIVGLTADGSVVIPQVALSDNKSRIAGSLDILVITPEGKVKIVDLKVSKNSIKDNKYTYDAYNTNDGSVLGGKLTTKQQHGIQVATYKKLVELQGFPVISTETVHIKLDLGKESVINDMTFEGIQIHNPSQNASFANKIIPTPVQSYFKYNTLLQELGMNNPTNDPNFLSSEEALPEEELDGDMYDKLFNRVEKIVDALETRKSYFENLKDSVSFRPKQITIDKINELIIMLGSDLSQGKPSLAYGRFLNYTKDELGKILDFTTNPKSKDKKEFASVLIEADKFLESYRGLIKAQNFGSKEQQDLLINVIDMLDIVKDSIDKNLQDHVKNLYQNYSNVPLTEEQLNSILEEVLDISSADYYLGDIATSTDPLLATVDKIVKNAIQKSLDATDSAIANIKSLGRNLLQTSGKTKSDSRTYDFMKVFNDKGKWTGRYITKVGQKYWDKYYSFKNKLVDKDGTTKQYIPIDDLSTASKEDILYNKQLYGDKLAQRNFLQAEVSTKLGMEDGDYHQYTTEFKNIRDKYEFIEDYEDGDGNVRYYWNKRPEISNEQYDLYRAKYYNKVDYFGAVIEPSTGNFEGVVTLKTGYFVKSEYTEIKDRSSKGEDMVDPKYRTMMEPKTTLEKAQSDFYNGWVSEMESTLEKLPPDIQRSMRGKVGRIRSSFIDAMKKNGSGFFEAVGKKMRNFFKADVYTNQRVVDENGQIAESVPIMYVGNLQNEKSIQNIKDKITLLDQSRLDKKISQKDYLEEKKRLNNFLRIEEGKVSSEQLEGDLVNNLIAFRAMAENFEAMSNVEADLKAIKKVIEERKYIQQDSTGKVLVKKAVSLIPGQKENVIKGDGESLAARRIKKYMKMVFYADEEFNKSTMAMVAQRIQELTSLKGIGFNVFGGVNNYIMGRINNNIEAAGSNYYSYTNSLRASKTFNTEHIPGWLRKLGHTTGDYTEHIPGSKYEALVDKFRIVRKNQQDSGRVDPISWAYMIQEGGEYNVQSKTGIAILMDKELINKKTGETLSIYDAYNFNPNTGELKLKDDFEYTDDQRYRDTNYIYEVNKKIHGNYAFVDRMVIQEHWLGQLAAQFHKWIYPAYKARFKERYFDQNLGDIEGRYLTMWNLVKYIYQSEGNLYDKIKSGWANMDEMQIANMRKNMAELGFLMSSIAMANIVGMLGASIPPDDKELKKFVNFLEYQQTRQAKEIYTMIPLLGLQEQYQMAKSPIAVLGTAKDFGDVMLSTMKLPFPPYDKNFYERGVHKDGLKLWKEMKDVIPALAILNRWDSFETVKSFYIK